MKKTKEESYKYHTDKPATPAKPTTLAAKSTVTKVVKMALDWLSPNLVWSIGGLVQIIANRGPTCIPWY